MKAKLRNAMFLAGGALLMGTLAQAGELTVTITDIKSTKGHLLSSIVNSDAGWNEKDKPVAQQKSAIEGKEVVLHFTLPAGSYGFQVFHDENDNGKLDTNLLHIPTEGYGYSNNPHVMRRAHYDEVRFELGDAPLSIVVHMQ